MITEPTQRHQRISQLMDDFRQNSSLLEEWGIKLDQDFTSVKTKQLHGVQIIDPAANPAKPTYKVWNDYEKNCIKHTQPMQLGK